MNKLTIAFLFDDSLDRPDGVQQYILALGNYFTSLGHVVYYLTGDSKRKDIVNMVPLATNLTVSFNRNKLSIPIFVDRKKIKSVVNDLNIDVLHVQLPYSPLLAGLVIRSTPKKVAIFGTFHIVGYGILQKYANKLLYLLSKNTLKRFNTIFSVSEPAKKFAYDNYHIKSEILPNVIDFNKYYTRDNLLKTNKKITILFVGRLVARKGCITLLESISLLKNKLDFEVLIAGDGPLKKMLKEYCVSNKIDTLVNFLGHVTESKKIELYQKADISVFPSTGGESFGIVLLEALSANHSVVLAADNYGYQSVLGVFPDLMFPVNDPVILSEKILKYATNYNLRKEVVQQGNTYVKNFDVKTIANSLLQHYKKNQ